MSSGMLMLIPAADAEPLLHAACSRRADELRIPAMVMPSEESLRNGSWSGITHYVGGLLPTMRVHLREMISTVSSVHAEIGRDVGTLYAVYYALLEKRVPVSANFHSPHLGGDTHFAQRNHLLIRRLAAMIGKHCANVNVIPQENGPELVLFPRYHHTPLIDGLHVHIDDRTTS